MKFNGIDLFAGAGGLSEGFIQTGFNIIGSVEKNKWACETLKTRHIYYHLKCAGILKAYWDYCRKTLSQFSINDIRDEIYKKNNGLKEEIENTIWQVEFGNPENERNVFSSKEVIQLFRKISYFSQS